MRIQRVLLALAVAASVAVTAPPAAAVGPQTQIQYFVSPHPDDIFESWSLTQLGQDIYPVFLTLTKGESTGYCQNTHATSISVEYWGTFNRATPAGCKGARMASLNNWLDDQSDLDGRFNDYVRAENPAVGYNMTKYVDLAPAGGTDAGAPTVANRGACAPAWNPSVPGSCTGGVNPNAGKPVASNLNPGGGSTNARTVTWYVGATSARVEFDLGDGNLTDAEVVWAVAFVRSMRATRLPLTAEFGVVAAGYSNLHHQYAACADYSHTDHRAVHETIYATDLIPDAGTHPQWGSTCGSQTTTVGVDGDVTSGGESHMIPDSVYAANMSTTASSFQKRFLWLHNGSAWPSGIDPVNPSVIFAQWNYFWRRFG